MKTLLLDIETSPNVVYTWGLWDQNVGLNQVVSTSEVICFSAKWLGAKGRPDFWSTFHDGREQMLHEAWELLDQADAVMHFNGKKFDIPHLNREFVEAGMMPPSPYAQIDLYLTARSRFKFQSNKLEHVSRQLGLEGKVSHEGFDLWKKCLAGDASAWARMRKYNIRDVTLLEDLYEILRPWIAGHPNVALVDGVPGPACPTCASTHLQRRGYAYTKVSVFPQYQCQHCGTWFRGAKRGDMDSGTREIRP